MSTAATLTPNSQNKISATSEHPSAVGRSIEYARLLMSRASITPFDAGCQDWLSEKLTDLGFECHRFSVKGVSNLVASIGAGERTIAFAGHTDVVPPGPLEKWRSGPFEAKVQDDILTGRGAADMKTGLAAMLAAVERFIVHHGRPAQRFVWLVTSDEEGEAEHGSKEIAAWLKARGIELDMCIVGEPTAHHTTGDNIKVGRRGALSAKLVVTGKQGHVAYPQYADNAVHKMQRMMANLLAIQWDEGSEDFPGTSLQVTYVNSGTFTDNIVPARCELCFNVRYSDRYHEAQLQSLIEAALSKVSEDFSLSWERPCEPYLTRDNHQHSLIAAVERSIHKNTGKFPLLSTSGGTSDGRFFASGKTQVVEIGVPNQTIHQVNECIHLADLVTLEDIYTDLLNELLGA